jgi:hypothetical protein
MTLWEAVKDLVELAPIYLDDFQETLPDTPDDYVVLIEDDYDTSYIRGDGEDLYRIKYWTIRFCCATLPVLRQLLKAYRKRLRECGIHYNQLSIIHGEANEYVACQLEGQTVYGDLD